MPSIVQGCSRFVFCLFLHSLKTVGKQTRRTRGSLFFQICPLRNAWLVTVIFFRTSGFPWCKWIWSINRTKPLPTAYLTCCVELKDEWGYLPINVLGSRLGEPLELRFVAAARLLEWFISEVFCCNKLLTLFVPLILELVNSTFDAAANTTGAPFELATWFPTDVSSKARLKKLACKALNGSIRRLGSYSSICWTSSLNFT